MRNGVHVRLQEQPFQLLNFLLEKNGQIATREEICQRLWKDNTHVDFDKSLGVAIAKVREALADSAANPRFVETLPRRGYRFIAPITIDLSPPPRTFESPAAPARDSDSNESRASSPHRFRWLLAAYLSAALTAGLLTLWWFHSRAHYAVSLGQQANGRAHLRRSVAVLGFRNLSGNRNYDWLSTAFTEMLHTELAATGDLRLVSSEDIANVKRDLSLSAENTLAKGTLAKLRSNLGADMIVLGSYAILPNPGKNSIRLDLRIQDTALGQTISEQAVTGYESNLFDLASQAGSRLRQSLSPVAVRAGPLEFSRSSGASNPLALQLYSQGRASLVDFDFVGARDFLKRAVAADPEFALAHSALSETWVHLGYGAEARNEARSALAHTQNLPQEEALQIRGDYQESTGDWSHAVLTFRYLFHLFPDNLTYGLRLVADQTHINAAEALSTVATMRKLPHPLGDDPRIDLAEASALTNIDMRKARASAKRAIDQASAHGANLMVARGLGILCQQDASSAQPMAQSVSECDLARISYIGAGDFNNAARTLNDLAGLYYQHGSIDKAESLWKSAIEEFRRVGDDEGLAAASNNLGDTLLTRGQLTEARILLENTITDYQRIGGLSGVALANADLGELAIEQADLPTATAHYAQAYSNACRSGDKSATAYALAGQGDVFLEQANLPAARDRYQSALALRKELGEHQTVTQTLAALARLDLEAGHPSKAESALLQSRAQSHHDQFADDELTAGLLLVEELLSTGKTSRAISEVASLRSLGEHTASRRLHLQFSLESARAQLALGDPLSAKTQLELVVKQAEDAGLVRLGWRARLYLAQANVHLGAVIAATNSFSFVRNHATAAGVALVVNEAVSLEAPSTAPR